METSSIRPRARLPWLWRLAALFVPVGWPAYLLMRLTPPVLPPPVQDDGRSIPIPLGLLLVSVLSALPFVLFALSARAPWFSPRTLRTTAWVGGGVGVLAWGLITVLCALYYTGAGAGNGMAAAYLMFWAPVLVTAVLLLSLAIGFVFDRLSG